MKPFLDQKNSSGRPVVCEICGKLIGKNQKAKSKHVPINNFRGDDLVRWRHLECHKKAQESAQ